VGALAAALVCVRRARGRCTHTRALYRRHRQRRYIGATATGFDLTPTQPPTDGCGKYLLLNVLVEELVDDAEEPMKRLESVFNLVGLVEALLLSMSITPFQDMKNWARDETNFAWGLSPLQGFCQKLGAYSLLITMGCCLVNLFLVTNVRSQPPPARPMPRPTTTSPSPPRRRRATRSSLSTCTPSTTRASGWRSSCSPSTASLSSSLSAACLRAWCGASAT
jgi:hypothetical protein